MPKSFLYADVHHSREIFLSQSTYVGSCETLLSINRFDHILRLQYSYDENNNIIKTPEYAFAERIVFGYMRPASGRVVRYLMHSTHHLAGMCSMRTC